jgi:hypothetical protein
MVCAMGKARRKSTAPIPLSKAPELAAKRLGVNDLDYAKIRLRERLKTAEYGRDWGAQAMHPPDARVDALWSDPLGGWEIRWEQGRAERCVLVASGIDVASERQYAVGLWIAPAVIDALAPAAPKGKSTGAPPWVNVALIEKTARNYIKKHGCPDNLTGEGGLIEKVGFELPEKAMPSKTRAWEILKSIFDSAQKKIR